MTVFDIVKLRTKMIHWNFRGILIDQAIGLGNWV